MMRRRNRVRLRRESSKWDSLSLCFENECGKRPGVDPVTLPPQATDIIGPKPIDVIKLQDVQVVEYHEVVSSVS